MYRPPSIPPNSRPGAASESDGGGPPSFQSVPVHRPQVRPFPGNVPQSANQHHRFAPPTGLAPPAAGNRPPPPFRPPGTHEPRGQFGSQSAVPPSTYVPSPAANGVGRLLGQRPVAAAAPPFVRPQNIVRPMPAVSPNLQGARPFGTHSSAPDTRPPLTSTGAIPVGLPPAFPGNQTTPPAFPGNQTTPPAFPGNQTTPPAQNVSGMRPTTPFLPHGPGSTVQQPMTAATTPPPPGPFAQRSAAKPSSPKIDPSQIPRPSHKESDPVIHFETRLNGQHQIPPLAATKFTCADTGNCDPKMLRLSLNYVPATSDLSNNLSLPLVAFLQPLALQAPGDDPIPIVDFGAEGPVRCGRCKAYMNPFMYFQDGGRSFTCVFCNVKNETPAEYFCYMGHDGKRRDAQERPELNKGTVEYVAPPAFMVRPPMPPVHFFLIDASYAAISSGALQTVCHSIKSVLDSIQGQDRALMGIATFGSAIEFYYIKNGDGSPQLLIVSDITEVFAPLPTLLMSVKENRESIEEILGMIPKLHENRTSGESCAGAAIEAAVEVLRPTGGKLHAILTTRPTKGNRSLKHREPPPASYTPDKMEKEKQTILLPQDNTYRTLGQTAAEVFVSIDLFCLAQHYIDISTCSVLCHMTGGSVYNYDKFTVQHSGQQFLNDLRWNLSRPQGLEAVLRLRCSAGLEIEHYLGSMNVRNQHEIELPAVDCDKSVMAKILHDDKIQEGTEAFFQCALLYTTTSGQRRIRVSTMGVPVTASANQVFRGADLECYMNYLMRKVSVSLPGNSLLLARETVTNGCIGPLAAYRKYCSTATASSGQLILPDSLKLLPMYTLGALKSLMVRTNVTPDERATSLSQLLSLPCSKILNMVYGRFFMLDPILNADQVSIPDSLPLSSEHLRESKLFLFENGQEMIIKIESAVPTETLQALFGFAQVNIKGPEPTVILSEHPLNIKLQNLLNELRTREGCYMSLRVALRSTPLETRFLNHLVDDRNVCGNSYVEFLCSVHRSIQNRLA